jgi:Cu(I)/Ag(I) efflux system membrane fusion protein
MNIRNVVIAIALIAALGAGAWWLIRPDTPAEHAHEAAESAPPPQGEEAQGEGASEPKVLYYYDPMRPDVHFDAPGKSPFMDMELVPKYAGDGDGDNVVVEIDPRMAQNLGIRTAPVTLGTFSHSFDAVGAVEVDERLIWAVESRAEGWVERLNVRAVGDPVKRGQAVAGVYSPELYSAQEELLLAAKSGDQTLVAASRQRLVLLGASEGQIADVLATGRAQRQTRVVAPNNGVVTELNVREGQKVMPGMPLVRIADLSRVWIAVEVPESLS